MSSTALRRVASFVLILALASFVLILALAGCASTRPPAAPVEPLLDDAWFAPPAAPVHPELALAPSAAMRERLAQLRASGRRDDDPRRLVLEALSGPRDARLRIDYDATATRTAAEAFDARRGNCLSLVLLTAAFARELGVPVRFQAVDDATAWAHAGGLALAVGHVNIALDAPVREPVVRRWDAAATLVVDFLPPAQAERLRSREIDEATVIAMFANNRAVEALADDRVDDAYWWARAAVRRDPGFDAAALTLAVVYRQRHRLDAADAALQRVLDRDPQHVHALADLAVVRRDQGRVAEAEALERRIAALGNAPPFSAFDAGVAAYRDGRLEAARHWFGEALRQPSRPAATPGDIEFWLARTSARLDDPADARRHLDRALAASGVAVDPGRYAEKLARLQALAAAP